MHDPSFRLPLSPQAASLPVADALPALLARLADAPNAVLIAPPGAGKTTLVPLALHGSAWLGDGRIVMLEPRRLAARAAALRMSALIGEEVGGLVGYRTRLDGAGSERTRIEVVTEGLLVRRLLADPTLDGVGCVILDEVHERSLDADTALAFCLDLQRTLRPELRLLAMSATLDGAALGRRLDAPVIESEGRMFPVQIRHAARDIPALRDLPDAMARAVRAAMAAEPDGDLLCFLPGVGEIRRVQTALADLGAEVLPLHGELPPAEQDRVLRPPPPADRPRRVVLATSIAETSLTVPGVRIVIDGGFRRGPRFDPGTGLTRLDTMRVSRATATQRSGRGGREAPGIGYRLWTEATGRGLAPHDRAEILDADLAGLRLQAACWADAMGTDPASLPGALPLPDAPPNGAWEAAGALLAALGAIDGNGRITGSGARMAALGAHPRLAAMMLAAETPEQAALAADLAALLEERDPLRARPAGTGRPPADPPADMSLRLDLLAGRGAGAAMDADRGALSRIRQAADGYRRRLRTRAASGGDPGALLAAAYPDRVAQRRGEPGSFRLAGGGGAKLGRADRLADAPLLAVASLQVRTGATIRLAAPLDPENLPPSLLARAVEQVESGLDPASGAMVSRRRLRLGALVLQDRTVAADPAETARILADAAAGKLDTLLDWTDAARQFQARVALLRRLDGDEAMLPDLSDEALAAGVRDWLEPALGGMTKLSELKGLDLHRLLSGMLDHAGRAALDHALPSTAALKQRRATIDYTGPLPTVAARAQDFFGTSALPVLADGRVRLQASLLSPASRPVAVTADLASFWRGGWTEVRREMRGRYPRHDWPEDPATAAPPAPRAR
ncbi:ATP-dependent helicase HrpB [Rhizosaccharibacter radicis]|uniref:ATP-dependent helicase HrpB n=1 Tax=Rhizosaccharibacter radicis TaxID=2782605 RepID=A0ABT1W1A6_9PROT|nr:ATP-dependent helicase HrpB [Acetobacteraceae bacterium KSS12]